MEENTFLDKEAAENLFYDHFLLLELKTKFQNHQLFKKKKSHPIVGQLYGLSRENRIIFLSSFLPLKKLIATVFFLNVTLLVPHRGPVLFNKTASRIRRDFMQVSCCTGHLTKYKALSLFPTFNPTMCFMFIVFKSLF